MRHSISIGIVLACLLSAGMVTTTQALMKYSTGSGGWHTANTWTPPGEPTANDTAIIMESHNVNINWGGPMALRLVINKGGKLTYALNVSLTIGGQLHNMGTLDGTYPLSGYTLRVGDTLKNYADATMTMFKRPLVVAGPFINEGSFTTYDGPILVTGDFTNSGAFTNASALLTFDGAFTNTAAGAFTNTGNAMMEFKGDFANHQADANFGLGTMTFSGSSNSTISGTTAPAFRTMAVNKSGGSLTLTCDLTVQQGGLTVAAGAFRVGEYVLTLGTTGASGSVNVGGGTFSAVGSVRDARAVVAAAGAAYPYGFTVNSGATIAARYADFRYMDYSGIRIANGAAVDATDNFSYCSFEHGTFGPMLKIENSQVIDNMVSVDFNGSAGYNVEKLADAGRIEIAGGTGTRWGEDYDNDPNNRIDWVVGAISEQPGLPAEWRPSAATVIRGVLVWSATTPSLRNVGDIALHSPDGRKVMKLVPGANDVRHLAPGVYFVRSETGNRLARVVIAR